MKKTFAFGAATGQGTWPVQEDGFFADPVSGTFAVADGFGGRGAGDMAAKIALLGVRGPKKPVAGDGRGLSPGLLVQREIFNGAHRAIAARNEGKGGAQRGGSSLVMASAGSGSVDITQCGACSVLLVREGSIRPILLPQASAREDFQPLLPDHALGVGEVAMFETRAFQSKAGDILMLLSSGVIWELESFREAVLAQLGSRMPGSDLSGIASQLVENGGVSAEGWNRTILLLELF